MRQYGEIAAGWTNIFQMLVQSSHLALALAPEILNFQQEANQRNGSAAELSARAEEAEVHSTDF